MVRCAMNFNIMFILLASVLYPLSLSNVHYRRRASFKSLVLFACPSYACYLALVFTLSACDPVPPLQVISRCKLKCQQNVLARHACISAAHSHYPAQSRFIYVTYAHTALALPFKLMKLTMMQAL